MFYCSIELCISYVFHMYIICVSLETRICFGLHRAINTNFHEKREMRITLIKVDFSLKT